MHNVATVNINNLPQSIYTSTDTTVLNQAFSNPQAYLPYTQFGSINYLSNSGHSTFHSVVGKMEHRFGSGFAAKSLFTYSKNLAGSAVAGYNFYDWRINKALIGNDLKFQFTEVFNYDLPFGRDRRFLNKNRFLDQVIGGWTFLTLLSLRSGAPVSFTSSGSPNKYLQGEGGLNIVPGQVINISGYTTGPNRFPQSAQNPFYNINAFAYPASFTQGNAGNAIARTGWLLWPQYSITKTWSYKEKYKLTARVDASNLFPNGIANSGNTTVNLTSPQNFGKVAATTGYGFSGFGSPNGTLTGVLRIAF